MSLPTPEPDLAIPYAYPCWHEHRKGQEEGRKVRPVVVVLAVQSAEGSAPRVTVAPITHTPTAKDGEARASMPCGESLNQKNAVLQRPTRAIVHAMSQDHTPDTPDDLLLFTPVETAYRGANGWSSAVQRAFVGALARTGVVAAAARSVGRSPSSAYQLRRRAGDDSPFAKAWDEAQGRACDEALDASMAGGTQVRRTEVWHRGRHVGWRTAYDNRLAYAALRALDRRDARWTAAGLDATMLLTEVMELPNGREMCEASLAGGKNE